MKEPWQLFADDHVDRYYHNPQFASDWILYKETYINKKELHAFVSSWLLQVEKFKVYDRLVVDVMCEWKEVDNQDLWFVKVYVKIAEKDFVVPEFLRRKTMNKKDTLKQKIAEAQAALDQAQKELKELNASEKARGWWKPEERERYFSVTDSGKIISEVNMNIYADTELYNCFNCFRTEDEARLEAMRISLRRKMKDIALRCDGREIDWSDGEEKYSVVVYWDHHPEEDEDDPEYDPLFLEFDFESDSRYEHFDRVYCYDTKTFMKVAYEELLDEFRKYFELKQKVEKELLKGQSNE